MTNFLFVMEINSSVRTNSLLPVRQEMLLPCYTTAPIFMMINIVLPFRGSYHRFWSEIKYFRSNFELWGIWSF